MNDERDMELGSTGEALCPECGEDVKITRRLGVKRWGWLWIVPKLFTIFAVLTVLILSLPTVQVALGSPWAIHQSTASASGQGANAFDPAISLGDIQAMLDGDQELQARVIEHFDMKMSSYGPYSWEAKHRFVAMYPRGNAQDYVGYGFLFSLGSSLTTSHLTDVRDRESWDDQRANEVEPGFSFSKYGFTHQTSDHDHAYQRLAWFKYIDAIELVASAWLILFVFKMLMGCVGVGMLHRRKSMFMGVVMLSVVCFMAAISMPLQMNILSMVDRPVHTSPWIEYQQFSDNVESMWIHGVVGDSFRASFAHLLEASEGEDFLLGLQIDYGHDVDSTYWWMSFGQIIEICQGQTSLMYTTDQDSNRVVVEYPSSIKRGLGVKLTGGRMVSLSWTSDLRTTDIKFVPMTILFLIASTIITWRVTHWVIRVWVNRGQRRRVSRDQCVFCAYPLTQEATRARYSEVES